MNMTVRFTTDENGPELERADVLAARATALGIIRAQMTTSMCGAEAILLESMGRERYERLLLDLANNIIAGFNQ